MAENDGGSPREMQKKVLIQKVRNVLMLFWLLTAQPHTEKLVCATAAASRYHNQQRQHPPLTMPTSYFRFTRNCQAMCIITLEHVRIGVFTERFMLVVVTCVHNVHCSNHLVVVVVEHGLHCIKCCASARMSIAHTVRIEKNYIKLIT